MPRFSVVTPVYNRERLVKRAIESVLLQSFPDFEIVVVDDGSTDRTAEAVLAFGDSRIRLLRHETNRGVCPARNTGVLAAEGEWVVFLDSDDELLPGALETIDGRIRQASEEIARLFLMCRLDRGGTSPCVPLTEGLQDYEGFVRWCFSVRGPMDPLDVTRRRTYEVVRFPESRATEALYHLDFARTFLTMTCPDVVAVRHSDAETRHAAPSVPDLLLDASDNALALETILERHGESIRSVCPGYYFHLRAKAGIYCLMAGWRGRGVRHLAVCLRAGSLPAEAWVGGIIGLCSPAWLAGALRSRRIRMLGSRRKRRADARGDAAA